MVTVAMPTGELADVRDARRAFLAVLQPWPQRAALYVVPAFMAACPLMTLLLVSSLGGGAVLIILGVGILMLAGIIAVRFLSRADRPLRPRVLHLFSRRVTVVVAVLPAFLVVAMLAWWVLTVHLELPSWGFAVSVFLFLVAFMSSLNPVAWRIDPYGINSRLLRAVPDHPACLDAAIGPRVSLMACAALAAVGQVGAGLLARALRVSEQDLSQLTAELVRGQYIFVYPQGGVWWVGLTPTGRVAYRRHLRALQLSAIRTG